LGKLDKSEEVIGQIPHRTENATILAQCHVHRAYCLRGRAKFEEALCLLAEVPERFPRAKELAAFSQLEMSVIHWMLGRSSEGWSAIRRAQKLCPNTGFQRDGRKSFHLYVPHFLEGNFEQATAILLEDSRVSDEAWAEHAQQAIKAGIMLELAGKIEKARDLWQQAARRFPVSRCCYLGSLALDLLSHGTGARAEEMPFPVLWRSEMHYLCGLLYEARGDVQRSRGLLALAWREDQTLRWPAYLARQKLTRGGQAPEKLRADGA
jgi:tetratricopeptide (TPR) repeat protein